MARTFFLDVPTLFSISLITSYPLIVFTLVITTRILSNQIYLKWVREVWGCWTFSLQVLWATAECQDHGGNLNYLAAVQKRGMEKFIPSSPLVSSRAAIMLYSLVEFPKYRAWWIDETSKRSFAQDIIVPCRTNWVAFGGRPVHVVLF